MPWLLTGLAAVLLTLGCIALLPTSYDEYIRRRDNSSDVTAEVSLDANSRYLTNACLSLRLTPRPCHLCCLDNLGVPDLCDSFAITDLRQVHLLQISESAGTPRQTGVLGASVHHWSSGRPTSTTVESSDYPRDAVAPAVPSDSSLEDVSSAADTVFSHVLGSAVQHDEPLVKLWTLTPAEAAAAAELSPQSLAHVALCSPTHGALSSVPLVDPIVQPTDNSIAEQPLQAPDNTREQTASNVDSTGTPTQRQSGIKVCTKAQYDGQIGCSHLDSRQCSCFVVLSSPCSCTTLLRLTQSRTTCL